MGDKPCVAGSKEATWKNNPGPYEAESSVTGWGCLPLWQVGSCESLESSIVPQQRKAGCEFRALIHNRGRPQSNPAGFEQGLLGIPLSAEV